MLHKPVDWVKQRVVLGGCGNNDLAGLVLAVLSPVDALDGLVVCLGAARGEDDLAAVGPHSLSDLVSGVLKNCSGVLAVPVN